VTTRKSVRGLGSALAAAVLFTGCGGGNAPPPATGGPGGAKVAKPAGDGAAAPGAAGAAFDAAKATATITITANLKGTPPKLRPIKMDAEPKCGDLHTEPLADETVVSSGGKLANVIVYVSRGAEKWAFPVPTTPAVMDQKGCQYIPHVQTVGVKQPLTIKNSDDVNHNVHATPKVNEDWNRSHLKGTADLSEMFPKAEVGLKVKCEVHPWMGAFFGVFEHPFHGVTGTDGAVSLPKLPPGDYEVSVWHEYEGFQKKPAAQKVTLADGETKALSFDFE